MDKNSVQYTEPVDFDEFEEEERVRGGRRKQGSGTRTAASQTGQVVGIGPTGCRVLIDGETVACKPKAGLAVGDIVETGAARSIQRILPRRTTLSRPDPMNPRTERVIAANMDTVVMVAAMHSPPLRPGLIDRYLIAIEKGGAEPVLCVNKVDLIEDQREFSILDPYSELGIGIFLVSTKTGQGLHQLKAFLANRLAVFVGHSGVGKSSLTNALEPAAGAATGALSGIHNRGRHTTTGSTMYQLANGLRVIDTPGIREFGLWQLNLSELAGYFRDFDDAKRLCQFSDCSHTHEPVCGVRDAVKSNALPKARYETYLRIRASLA